MDVAQRKVGRAIATVPEQHGWEGPPTGWRFNDGKASPGGAFIVGRMHMNWRKGEPGRLYRHALSASVSSGIPKALHVCSTAACLNTTKIHLSEEMSEMANRHLIILGLW